LNEQVVRTTDEAARLVGVNPWVLTELCRNGKLTPLKLHRIYLWRDEDIDAARRIVVPGRRPGWPKKQEVVHATAS
jgi:hypothetical protein